tara:strand:+ start:449 stop:721 length:273 start_codon:yes stop_codon:yes gene_type:complete
MKKLTLSVATLLIAGMSYGQSTQCKALTKDSVQCKNKTSQVTCYLHNSNYKSESSTKASVCTGTTKSGNNCKNKTKNTNQLCHLHTPKND